MQWKQQECPDGFWCFLFFTSSKAPQSPFRYQPLETWSMTYPGQVCKALKGHTWTVKTESESQYLCKSTAHTISQFVNQKMNIKMNMNIIHMFTYYFVFRALVNAMKSHSHLMEVDALLVRSCLYLLPLDELMECVTNINIELLDMLHVFTNKVPQDISYSNFQVSCKQKWSGTCWGYGEFDWWMFLDFCLQVVSDLLTHIQGNLVEEKYRWFAFLNAADFQLS